MSKITKCDHCKNEYEHSNNLYQSGPNLYNIIAPKISGTILPEADNLDFCSLDCIINWATILRDNLKLSFEITAKQDESVKEALNAIDRKDRSDIPTDC